MLKKGGMYPKDASDRDYEGYQGNYGPTLTLTYRQAFVVMWPKSKALKVKIDGDFDGVLDSFISLKSDRDTTEALNYITAIVDKVIADPQLVLKKYRSRIEPLLKAMTSFQTSSEVMCMLFGKVLDVMLNNSCSQKGLIDVETAGALAHALKPFWHSKDILQKATQLLLEDVKINTSTCVAFVCKVYSSGETSTANKFANGVCNLLLENPEKNTQK